MIKKLLCRLGWHIPIERKSCSLMDMSAGKCSCGINWAYNETMKINWDEAFKRLNKEVLKCQ